MTAMVKVRPSLPRLEADTRPSRDTKRPRLTKRTGTAPKAKRKAGKRGNRKTRVPERLSRTKKPEGLSLEAWQTELRRQFGSEQQFKLKNVGEHPVFSVFEVTNPASKSTYRVAIRGREPGENYCACADFGTNSLGTCKHIEFTLAKLLSRRSGKESLAQGFQPAYSEVFLKYGAEREVRFRAGQDCPRELARAASRFFDDEGRLLGDAYLSFDIFLSQAGKIDHDLRTYDDVLGFVAEHRDAHQRRERIGKAFPRGIKSAAFKDLLRAPMYDYQRQGALFAAEAGRSLIGDEMGLGKTIQAIAAAEIMARELGVERVLIVCPTSLKHQWEREIEKFCQRSAEVISGLSAKRERLFQTESFYKITNYDTIHRDLNLISAWAPDLVILDEAQRIKNWNTRAAKSVKKLSSPYAVVLTGTPLENRLEELVSIVQFVDPHRLGPTFRFMHDHQVADETGRVVGYRNLDQIGQTLAPILLRRRKDEVLKELPPRLEKKLFVPMTPQQYKHHDENREIVARIVRKWRRFGFLTEAEQRGLMIALQNMRMSCDSSYLLDQSSDYGVKADELATLLDELFEDRGTKVVIFSQWLRMHELLVRRMKKAPWQHVLFHGGIETGKRRGLIDRFREDQQCRAFLSTDAGGVGLNLQHANVVVNMDLPWNPAVLEQRIGRVHRLGQTRPVQVVNFVAQGTIEEGMLEVLRFKKSLFAGVLDGGEKEVFLGGSRLSKFIETVENVTKHIPAAEVEASANGGDRGPADAGDSHNGSAAKGRNGHAPSRDPGLAGEAADERRDSQDAPQDAAQDPLSGLVAGGLALLEGLVRAATTPASRGAGDDKRPGLPAVQVLPAVQGLPFGIEVARDAHTGQPYLKLQMPKPEVLNRALDAFSGLLEILRGG